jgi:hypothetical protein
MAGDARTGGHQAREEIRFTDLVTATITCGRQGISSLTLTVAPLADGSQAADGTLAEGRQPA